MSKGEWAIVVLGVALGVALVTAGLLAPDPPSIPQCPEDAVIVGNGEFDNGLWDWYSCGPALDDFAQDADINKDGAVNVLDVQDVVNAYLDR